MADRGNQPPGRAAVLFQALAGFAIVALVVFGVAGTVYKLISPDGWLAQAFGKGLAGGLTAFLGVIWIAVFAWATREWISARRRNKFSDLFVYVFAASGLFYTVQLILYGGL
jgi:hypothetical protein